MTIQIGTWIIPLLISIFSFSWAFYKADRTTGGDYSFYIPVLETVALIVSLFSWLIWALAT